MQSSSNLKINILRAHFNGSTMSSKISLNEIISRVPTTRYQGSKRRILPWIYQNIKSLKFDTVLDGFGGTGSVSYLFKMMGKRVTFNDALHSNYQTGVAFIENNNVILTDQDINFLINKNGFNYPSFIQDTFKDIYYLDKENKWLDVVVHNIFMLSEKYQGKTLLRKRALAFHALFQACLSKRPYNLFHRKNLYMRVANVKRSFGNKRTWDAPFDELFIKFCLEGSNKVFSNNRRNNALCKNILKIKNNGYDLVYLDPPYIKSKTAHPVDYYSLYHFLEGISDYYNWEKRIDYSRKNKPLIKNGSFWNKNKVEKNLDRIFNTFSDSIIVISYGDPGYPSIDTIKELLLQYKNKVTISKKEYTYKLNNSRKNGNKLYEVLIIAQ